MDIRVRQGRHSDLRYVAEQYRHEDTPWDPFGSEERLSRIPLDGLLIAEVDGDYAGFLYWFEGRRPYFRPNLERFADLTELHVKEEYRRKGVAKLLMTKFIEDVKGKGIIQAFVDTDDDNTVAQNLYEEFGFQKYREVHHYERKL